MDFPGSGLICECRLQLATQSWPRALPRLVAMLCIGVLATGVFAGAVLGAGATAGRVGGQAGPDGTAEPLVVALDFVGRPHEAGAKVRTLATIDIALAADLARRLQRPLAATASREAGEVAVTEGAIDGARGAAPDLRITTVVDPDRVPSSMIAIALGYRMAPMAIMRTDSTIRRWQQLRGRSVCVAVGGSHVGDLRDRYAAIEIVHATLTEALVALRVGACDALVHDSVLLEELLRLPEWQKFSRRLDSRERRTLAVLVPRRDPLTARRVRAIAAQWESEATTNTLMKDVVRNIAFEVYVEQEVPDCH